MVTRKKPRIKMVVPIRLWGMDSTGQAFNILAYTLNVSSIGARIGGVRVPLAVGEAVTLQYKQNRALFKVIWVGRPGDPTREQIGVALLEQDRPIWGEIDDPANFTDDFKGKRKERPVQAAPAPTPTPIAPPTPHSDPAPAPAPTLNAEAPPLVEATSTGSDVLPVLPPEPTASDPNRMLQACAEGLLKIDEFVRKEPPDAAALQKFRDAIARVRETVWGLQKWHEANAEGKRAFPLLSYINAERIRYMSQAAKDLADDIEFKGVEVDRSLLQTLVKRVERIRSIDTAAFKMEVLAPDNAGGSPVSAIQVALRAVITDALRSGMSETDTLALLARELQRAMRADGVAVAKFEEGEMVCLGSNGNAPEPGMVLETETGIGAEALREGQMIYCEDTQHDTRVDAELCHAANIGAVVVIPVTSTTQEPVGMVQVSTARPNPFSNEELAALDTAAGLVRDVVAAKAPIE